MKCAKCGKEIKSDKIYYMHVRKCTVQVKEEPEDNLSNDLSGEAGNDAPAELTLPNIEDITKDEIKERLKALNVSFNSQENKETLYKELENALNNDEE